MANEYWEADEVEEIAQEVIKQYHGKLLEFGVQIKYLFRSQTPKKGDKEIWGRIRKVTGLSAFLATGANEPFFVVEIPSDVWGKLTDKQKRALLDHELCHAQVELDDESDIGYKISLRGHDLEEFALIVRRHGLWKDDVEWFMQETRQMELFE